MTEAVCFEGKKQDIYNLRVSTELGLLQGFRRSPRAPNSAMRDTSFQTKADRTKSKGGTAELHYKRAWISTTKTGGTSSRMLEPGETHLCLPPRLALCAEPTLSPLPQRVDIKPGGMRSGTNPKDCVSPL